MRKAWGFHPGPEDADVFVCGNPEMAETMVGVLGKEGFREHAKEQPKQIHIERYW
ncbi:MAG: hypothetical protein WD049_02575 [Candidatus Paceibacterota bacterium]